MIIFELACSADHRFEGWFASSDDFESQRDRRLLACPICASTDVAKIPHAKIAVADARAEPRAEASRKAPPGPAAGAQAAERFQAVAAFVQRVLEHTEDVGAAFPEEARRIHYEEVPGRAIRGIASAAETRELIDEGIAVLPLPLPPTDDLH